MIDLKEIDYNESTLEIFEHVSNDVNLKITDIYQTEGVVEVYITCKNVTSVKIEGENDVVRKYHDDGEIIFLEIKNQSLEMLVCWTDFSKKFIERSVYFMYHIYCIKIDSVVVEGINERPGSDTESNDKDIWPANNKIIIEDGSRNSLCFPELSKYIF